MGKPLETLAIEALKLSPQERIELADRLLASVFADDQIEQAWAEEIERRIQHIESGQAELVSAADAVARARAAIK